MSLQNKRNREPLMPSRFIIIVLVAVVVVLMALLLTSSCPPQTTRPTLDCNTCPKEPATDCPEPDCEACPRGVETKTVYKYQCYDGSIEDKLQDCPDKTEESSGVKASDSCAEIVSHNDRYNELNWYIISGEVKNNCATTKKITIYFVLYDKDDEVLSSTSTMADPWDVALGDTHGFEQYWLESEVVEKVDRYTTRAVVDEF